MGGMFTETKWSQQPCSEKRGRSMRIGTALAGRRERAVAGATHCHDHHVTDCQMR